jgi:hypothetical protein
MDMLSKFSTPIIGFLITIAFGFWVGKLGRPYNGILFNIHKLIGLGTVVLASIQVYRLFKTVQPESLIILLTALVALCVIALFASGAFLSIGNLDYGLMRTVHNVALIVAVICCGMVVYLLSVKL